MLYVTRHGQTEWNLENKVCGITNINLTDKGIEQAKYLAEKLSKCEIDIIISSPMKRAKKTSEIILNIICADIILDDRLFEQNYGIYEGAQRDNIDFQKAKKQFAIKYPHGESMFQVTQRVYNLIDEIKEKYSSKNILIISHGGVCRVIHTYFNDIANEDFGKYVLGNCEIKAYKFS